MSEAIEPNCLAALLSQEDAKIMGEIVRVIERVPPIEIRRLMAEKSLHCSVCLDQVAFVLMNYGINDFWHCESDINGSKAHIHESLLRRLPPPDIEKLITSKDASAPT